MVPVWPHLNQGNLYGVFLFLFSIKVFTFFPTPYIHLWKLNPSVNYCVEKYVPEAVKFVSLFSYLSTNLNVADDNSWPVAKNFKDQNPK